MDFHLPKPLHGWREFVGEVGIIVIGVLIALGAEQLVEAAHWRSETAQFRKAFSMEMADSLAAYRYRIEQEPCVQRRIRELDQWVAADRAGLGVRFNGDISRPSLYTFRTSVWKASSSDMMNHLSMDARQTFSQLYDALENADSQIDQEEEIWRNLNAFDGPPRLNDDTRLRVKELIYRAKSADDLVTSNYAALVEDAADAGMRPEWGKRKNHVEPPDPAFCRPLFSRV